MEAFCLVRGHHLRFFVAVVNCSKHESQTLLTAPFVGLVIDMSGMILKRTNPNIKDDELRLKEIRFKISI